VVNPLNPNGTVITNNIDSRIDKAAEWSGTLVATHSVGVSGTEDDAQWYAINVGSGTPTLQQQGRVSSGNNTYITYPSIDINAAGQIGMTYMQSGTDSPTDYLSMYVTGRDPSDAAGTMENSVVVPAGTGQANYKDFSSGGRAGDLSGINVDPSDGNSFWAADEFANTEAIANWGTAVANFTVSNPLPPADVAVTLTGPSGTNAVTAGNSYTYTITVSNNSSQTTAQNVVLSDVLPAGWTLGTISPANGNPDAFSQTQSGGTLTETASSIPAGNSDTFSVVVNVPANAANGASFSQTATVQANNPDTNSTNNSATVTGTVFNPNATPNLSVTVSGPASSSEGSTVTYTITVTNSGSASASNVTLTDTLGSILNFKSATPQGTYTVSNGVVTFTLANIAAGGTATATVTAQAIEDGSTSDVASLGGSNSASATTSFAEPSIGVSGSSFTTRSSTFSGQVATFTHASGVEPASAFSATINWGDGTTSTGSSVTITLSGGTYTVSGSHHYTSVLS
jgi:uncharacterized repeat protein (TIGR01451 family)